MVEDQHDFSRREPPNKSGKHLIDLEQLALHLYLVVPKFSFHYTPRHNFALLSDLGQHMLIPTTCSGEDGADGGADGGAVAHADDRS